MLRLFPRIVLTLLAASISRPGFAADKPTSEPVVDKLNKPITGVTVTGTDGKTAELADLQGKKGTVLVVLCFECPVSASYSEPLTEMARFYGDKGIRFLGVVPGEEPARIAKLAKEYKVGFPLFADPKLAAIEAVKATTTPEAFLLDHNGVLRYRGRIDNAYSARLRRNSTITSHDLRVSLEALLDGKDIPVPATKPIGCPVDRREGTQTAETAKVTFHRDVLPILQTHCQGCHRPGQVGPFSLLTYKQSVNWAEDIKEFTKSKKMPPWKPTAGVPFKNERSMPEKDIAVLAAWADAGCPEGDPKDAPAPVKFADDEWVHGKPDLILTPSDDFHVGAAGKDVFRCFVLPTGLTEDTYVVGYEVKPGNPRVVHHTLNFWDRTGKARKLEKDEQDAKKPANAADRGPGYSVSMGLGFFPIPDGTRPDVPPIGAIGGWAPGQQPVQLPAGTAYFLPKGADLVIQTHYHRTGKPETDRLRVGLYFAKKPTDKPYQSIVINGMSPFASIPAGEAAHKAKGSVWLGSDATVYSVMPHMHLIGRKIKVTMTPPESEPITLVDIQDWDYNWQESYWLKKPIHAKAGTRFDVEAIYDNSRSNPNNPNNPPKDVRFGEQTTNEMLFGFLGATSDKPGKIRVLKSPPRLDKPDAKDAKPAAKPEAKRFEIPYRLTDTKHILVRAKLNGKGPFNFILDTGAPAVFIPKKVAEKAGVKLGDDGWGTFDKFEIEGGLVSEKARTRVEDLFQLEGMNGLGLAGVELHGVIGYNVLAKYRITYDFTADKLIFVPLEFDPPPIKGVGKGGQGGLEILGPVMKMLAGFMGITPNFETRPRGFVGIELDERDNGVFVKSVLEGSPAAKAGLQPGDQLRSVSGVDIDDPRDLKRAMAKTAPKDAVKFVIKRDGKEQTMTVTLGEGL